MKGVVITGYGVVSAIGGNRKETLDSLLGRRSGIGKMLNLSTFHCGLPVGEVKLDDGALRKELGIADDVPANRTALLGIKALKEALDAAGLPPDLRFPLISGTTVGGMEKTELYYRDFLTSDRHSEYIPLQGCGATTALTAGSFSCFNDLMTPSTACSSSANAIIRAADLILAGEADVVAAGGSECLSSFHLSGFNSLMILDRERCRPFDRSRAGLNLGEGAAYLILESEEHALRRGAKIAARLSGYANVCDAFHQTASSPDGEGAYLSMTKAIAMAGLQPGDIDYVNAHGTGTPNNDASESAALRRVFGDRAGSEPPVSSTKSFTGHTTSASGSIESAFCLLAMENSFIPANLGWTGSGDGTIVPSTGDVRRRLRNVLCNAFGFGGNDSSLIFSEYVQRPCTPERRPCEADRHILVEAMSMVRTFPESAGVSPGAGSESRDGDADWRRFITPMEGRRMGMLMKRAVTSSLTALGDAGLTRPDAIFTGTALGSVNDMETVLNAVCENGGESVRPTAFMQSTHNTIGSLIAIRTGTHGCNCTWSQETLSFEDALADAADQLRLGRIDNALVGAFDEFTPDVLEIQRRNGILKDGVQAVEVAASFVLRASETTAADSVAGLSPVELLAVRTCYVPESERQLEELSTLLASVLGKAGLRLDDIDLVLTGRHARDCGTAVSDYDAVYDRLAPLWERRPQSSWKSSDGEGFASSAAGFHEAVSVLRTGNLRNVIVFNHFRGVHFSMVLLHGCDVTEK